MRDRREAPRRAVLVDPLLPVRVRAAIAVVGHRREPGDGLADGGAQVGEGGGGEDFAREAGAGDLDVEVPVDAEVVDVDGGLLERIRGLYGADRSSVIVQNKREPTDRNGDIATGEGEELPHVDAKVTVGPRW